MDTEEPKQLTTFGLVKPWNWGMDSTLAAEANIVAMESASEAARQIALEQLSVLHSIRRILFATLVIVPLLAAAIGAIMVVATAVSASKQSCSYSAFSTHC